MGRVVAAVHATPGQVDANVRAFQVLDPWAGVLAIPVNGLPGRGIRAAGQHGHLMAPLLKISRQRLADLPAAAGQHNAQRVGGYRVHGFSLQRWMQVGALIDRIFSTQSFGPDR